ncbi:hypothetical protein MNV49_006129 [Pseudohyphozyma bogoriensis]|nr:hypothetical protein MNV49_006129 [Pseudohyphozyma bogoriensis]
MSGLPPSYERSSSSLSTASTMSTSSDSSPLYSPSLTSGSSFSSSTSTTPSLNNFDPCTSLSFTSSLANPSGYKSPYATLQTPCDVCHSRSEGRAMRTKILAESPWLVAEPEEIFVPTKGPCVERCGSKGYDWMAQTRARDIEEAKRWLATQPIGRKPR